MSIPGYRVRLFLTVDLVGSTAYKASFLNNRTVGKDPLPEWVTRFRQFYQQFPEALSVAYQKTDSGHIAGGEEARDPPPQVWKTIGDEIIFCCRLNSVQHLACCVTAFLRALEVYGQSLDTDGVPLDVKGAGWLAAFPAENISIEVFDGNVAATGRNQEYLTEDFEREADRKPHKFDFLGTGIDAGFRVAKNASADRFTSSIGLAYLLADAAQSNMFSGQFSYHGRQPMKGVNKDHPYPVVSIEAERNPDKRKLRARERLLTNENYVAPVALFDYLDDYMKHEGIDHPVLRPTSADQYPSPPPTYKAFEATWQLNVKEANLRDRAVDEGEAPENQTGDELSAEVLKSAGMEPKKIRLRPARKKLK
ncbi:hypothetical protein [Rhizobium sp. S96]|uniref:hypothetical protein n=1 Tax=Rhizobium sp. S96 TaxID=3055140 RepID=UPI0025AB3CDD|nr:hypothetical protein [Rhizobium sp. S96]MDM9623036.1 hypothetical protein [Rhizobium sp. S96]